MDCNEAIEILKDMKGVFGERGHSGYSLPALDLAIEALEKQIAKKPKKIKLRQGTQWLCPACGNTVAGLRVDLLYCNECGQKLDWSWEPKPEKSK